MVGMTPMNPLPLGLDELATSAGCTLPTAERPLRLAEFDDLFASSAHRIEHEDTSARIDLSGSAGLADRVRDLTERETSCCAFFTFLVDGTDQDLRLSIEVPTDRRDVLAAMVARARELAA